MSTAFRPLKILYVIRSARHISYHDSVLRALVSRGHAVRLLVGWDEGPPEGGAPLLPGGGVPGVEVDWASRRREPWRAALSTARELRSYRMYLQRRDQSEFYRLRCARNLPCVIRQALRVRRLEAVLTTAAAGRLLGRFEELVPPDRRISRLVSSVGPDVVVASPANMTRSVEVEYLKAAKASRTPTVVPVLSWDNLTTKGLLGIQPDLTLAWNRTQAEEATQIHGIPPDRTLVTGSPFFDRWLCPNRLFLDRETFCERVGLEPRFPFVLYLGSSVAVARDETWLVRELSQRLASHHDPTLQSASLLVRPHPANASVYEGLDGPRLRVWPRGGSLPDSEDALRDFANSLTHAVAAVGINTTGMIDAVIAGRPCLAVTPALYSGTQLRAAHFRYLLAADVLHMAQDAGAAVDVLCEIVGGQDHKEPQREAFVRDFAFPRGRHRMAGEFVADAIELSGRGAPPAEVQSALDERSQDRPSAGRPA